MPRIFSILREQYPDVVTGCIAEWDGIKHVVDSMAIDCYDLAPDWEHHTSLLCEMAERFIIDRKPTLFAVCWDQLDHTGHSIGHDTPEYYKTLAELDVYVGRLIQALKTLQEIEKMEQGPNFKGMGITPVFVQKFKLFREKLAEAEVLVNNKYQKQVQLGLEDNSYCAELKERLDLMHDILQQSEKMSAVAIVPKSSRESR